MIETTNDISPYYRYAGIFLLAMFGLTVCTFLAAVLLQTPMTSLVIKLLGILAVVEMLAALMIIIRDERFDRFFRILIGAIPWTKFENKPNDTP